MKLYIYTFTVTGKGDFPVDMLRYDSVYPVTEGDSFAMAYKPTAAFRPLPTITVTVEHRSTEPDWLPTVGRWESFGWSPDLDGLIRTMPVGGAR